MKKVDGNAIVKKISKKVELELNLIEGYYLRGKIYDRRKKYLKALIQYSKVVELNTDRFKDIYKLRSIVYFRLQNYKASLKDLDIAIERSTGENYQLFQLIYLRASVYMKLGKKKKSLVDFERVLKNHSDVSNFPNIRKYVCVLSMFAKNWDTCLEYCNKFGKNELVEILYCKALSLEKLKKWNEAVVAYRRVERLLNISKKKDKGEKVDELIPNIESLLRVGIKRTGKHIEIEEIQNFRETVSAFHRESYKIKTDFVEVDTEELEGDSEEEEMTLSEKEKKVLENYNKILGEAKEMKFADFENLKIITFQNCDRLGRKILFVKESPLTKEQIQRLLHYFILKIDPFKMEDYIIVWSLYNPSISAIQRTKANSVKPGLSFVLNAYRSLCKPIRKSCKKIIFLHPGFYIKLLVKFFGKVISPKSREKIIMCSDMLKDKDFEEVIDVMKFQWPLQVYVANVKKNKTKIPPVENQVFKKRIDVVMKLKCNEGREIPLFLENCFKAIEKKIHFKGLFRKAGSQNEVLEMKDIINYGYDIDFTHSRVHVVCSVVKLWFREMPDKIFPEAMFDDFISQYPDTDIKEMQLLIDKLPTIYHYNAAKALFQFLGRILDKSDLNLMDAKNLSIVFAPNLLKKEMTNIRTLAVQSNLIGVVEFIILNTKVLFSK